MTKKKTVRMTVRVSAEVAENLQAKALIGNAPLTELGGELLTLGLSVLDTDQQQALLMPLMRNMLRGELKRFTDAIHEILLRSYLESGTSRRLIQGLLLEQPGVDRGTVIEVEAKNWNNALQELNRDSKGVRKWMREQQTLAKSLEDTLPTS